MKFFLFALIFIYSCNAYCSDTTSVRYFPLNTGDLYVYTYHSSSFPFGMDSTSYQISRVVYDTIINNKKYYYITGNPDFGSGLVRTDTTTGSLYKYDALNSCNLYQNEKLIDSLSALSGIYYITCGVFVTDVEITNTNIFNYNVQIKNFYNNYPHSSHEIRYAKDFGISYIYYSASSGGFGSQSSYTLKGCIINGISYGDTSVPVGIKEITSSNPAGYSLNQNYPNPFNPSTTIKYRIEKNTHVTISIFDIIWAGSDYTYKSKTKCWNLPSRF